MPSTSALAAPLEVPLELQETAQAVSDAARHGLAHAAKWLSPWLFYDEAGSDLFEQITRLPEYYLTRTERALFVAHADDIFNAFEEAGSRALLTVAELGAGTATKTGVLLDALVRRQKRVLYQPIDISPSALDETRALERSIPGVTVCPQVANYITDTFLLEREPRSRVLALYIGSSVGNFSPAEARTILRELRARLVPGDALLLGTDLAPSTGKSVATLLAAYDDSADVTGAFNRNMLHRLNRELGADFDLEHFRHSARWNPAHSRVEMHLESTRAQTVRLPAHSFAGSGAAQPELLVRFAPGETIHTENSYKFTDATIAALLHDSGFAPTRTFTDPQPLFAITLAAAV